VEKKFGNWKGFRDWKKVRELERDLTEKGARN
jgi:hypothetical protein